MKRFPCTRTDRNPRWFGAMSSVATYEDTRRHPTSDIDSFIRCSYTRERRLFAAPCLEGLLDLHTVPVPRKLFELSQHGTETTPHLPRRRQAGCIRLTLGRGAQSLQAQAPPLHLTQGGDGELRGHLDSGLLLAAVNKHTRQENCRVISVVYPMGKTGFLWAFV